MTKSRSDRDEVGRKHGFRSGLEASISHQLAELGLPVLYEQFKIEYTVPARKAKYTPDFILPNGIIIETKGRFKTEDRHKHLLIKSQYPDLDLRFVFSNPGSRISKTSSTTYAMWCEKHGFLYAKMWIPKPWIDLPPEEERLNALANIGITNVITVPTR